MFLEYKYVCSGSLSLSQNSLRSVFCSKTNRNGIMSAPLGSAQKQHLFLCSKQLWSTTNVFSVRLCANIRLSYLLSKERPGLSDIRGVGLSKEFVSDRCLSSLPLSGSISFPPIFENDRAGQMLFMKHVLGCLPLFNTVLGSSKI